MSDVNFELTLSFKGIEKVNFWIDWIGIEEVGFGL
jgi:hypothetical protein